MILIQHLKIDKSYQVSSPLNIINQVIYQTYSKKIFRKNILLKSHFQLTTDRKTMNIKSVKKNGKDFFIDHIFKA